MSFCGPFFGRFHNEFAKADEDSEEDRPSGGRMDRMVYKKEPKAPSFWRSRRRSGDGSVPRSTSSAGASGGHKWNQHLKEIRVQAPRPAEGGRHDKEHHKVMRLRVVNKTEHELPQTMMSSIFRLGNRLHTIEIIRCHRKDLPPFLNELDILAVFNMSHNELRTFSPDLARCTKLEQIILEWNKINDIPQGIFAKDVFANLVVLNVSHNSLTVLPEDFVRHTPNVLKLLNLSNNMISHLPEGINECGALVELDVSHNSLKQLPEPFVFEDLTKLFISFNELTKLPDRIGECKKVVKIRAVENKIRELPASILDLWDESGRGGLLEEFLVEKNPLQVPTITAFQMVQGAGAREATGARERRSFDRAFGLFQQELERREAERAQLQQALQDAEREQQLAIEAAAAPSEALARSRGASSASRSGLLREPGRDDTPLEDEDGNPVRPALPEESHLDPYWFGHCEGDAGRDQITAIRRAESSMLMLKRSQYVELAWEARLAALEREAESAGGGSRGGDRTTEKDAFVRRWAGAVPVQGLDLHFCLLVYTTKPHFPSIKAHFERFSMSHRWLTKDEWTSLVHTVPMELGMHMSESMWQMMNYNRSDKISLTEFAAAWHIHDLEAQDPWIVRLAGALRLDYYDMGVDELRQRLRARDGLEAIENLDSDERWPGHANTIVMQAHAHGEKRTGESLAQAAFGEGRQGNKALDEGSRQQWHRKQLANKVSLDDAEYHEVEREGSDGGVSDASLESCDLSEYSSDGSTFDAVAVLRRQQETDDATNADLQRQRIVVNSDEALKRLMELSPEEFNRQRELEERSESNAMKEEARSKGREAAGETSGSHNGLGIATDAFAVRQSLREVYRSMPPADFLGLVNFLLRGLQLLKHSHGGGDDNFWHKDNPAFAHAMGARGANAYTRRLLRQMGFVLLNGTYWVWPSVHLDMKTKSWGTVEVPLDCPGRDARRLDDMIELLKSCQIDVHQQGPKFNGHFKSRHVESLRAKRR